MEPLSPTRFVLLLHSLPHVGEKTLTRLLHHNALHRISPDAFLSLPPEEWQTRYELDPRAIACLCEQRDHLLTQSEEMARTVRQHNVHVLTPSSLTYPARLERFDDAPPPVLYALGNLALLDQSKTQNQADRFRIQAICNLPLNCRPKTEIQRNNKGKSASTLYTVHRQAELEEKTFAERTAALRVRKTAVAPFIFSIAVSNGASPDVLARQDSIAEDLVRRGCVPVTGHDRAAYKRLALAAQRQNRPTIYVMDRGLREALGPDMDRPPFSAARIRETVFDTERDLALSPFRLNDHALGANNRRRDRLIYALADLIVALDVRAGGGMAAECLRAQQQGRLVWVAEGGRDGNEELRRQGVCRLARWSKFHRWRAAAQCASHIMCREVDLSEGYWRNAIRRRGLAYRHRV